VHQAVAELFHISAVHDYVPTADGANPGMSESAIDADMLVWHTRFHLANGLHAGHEALGLL
jgi:hypothetical protein